MDELVDTLIGIHPRQRSHALDRRAAQPLPIPKETARASPPRLLAVACAR
jgi:hypothetical protein